MGNHELDYNSKITVVVWDWYKPLLVKITGNLKGKENAQTEKLGLLTELSMKKCERPVHTSKIVLHYNHTMKKRTPVRPGRLIRRPLLILIYCFSAYRNALLLGPKILLGGRTDSRTDVRPATCNI